MAPMPNPRIVVAVSVDEPTAGSHFGGQVSGPVFSAIAGDTLRTLNMPPDMPVKQMVVSDDSAPVAPAAPTLPPAAAKKLATNVACQKNEHRGQREKPSGSRAMSALRSKHPAHRQIADALAWLHARVQPGAHLHADTRRCSGDVFFAYAVDGADNRPYIDNAIERGAAAVLYQPENFAGAWTPRRRVPCRR